MDWLLQVHVLHHSDYITTPGPPHAVATHLLKFALMNESTLLI